MRSRQHYSQEASHLNPVNCAAEAGWKYGLVNMGATNCAGVQVMDRNMLNRARDLFGRDKQAGISANA
jgi:hypothetical protein